MDPIDFTMNDTEVKGQMQPSSSGSSVVTINPLEMECVLEVMLNFLDTQSLISCRLVSRLWDEEAVKVLMQRRYQSWVKCPNFRLFEAAEAESTDSEPIEYEPDSSDEEFAMQMEMLNTIFNSLRLSRYDRRRIPSFSISSSLDDDEQDEHGVKEFRKIVYIISHSKHPSLFRSFRIENWTLFVGQEVRDYIENYGQYLDHLDIGISRKSCETALHLFHNFLTIWCPNLTKLHIRYTSYDDYEQDEDEPEPIENIVRGASGFQITQPLQLRVIMIAMDNTDQLPMSDEVEQFLASIINSSSNLKDLSIDYKFPLKLLKSISQMEHVIKELDTLTINCDDDFCDQFVPFLLAMKFKSLRVLRLKGLESKINKWENLGKLSPSLKKLKLIEIFNDEPNLELPGAFIAVLSHLPELQELNWTDNSGRSKHCHSVFEDLKRYDMVHEHLTYLKIEEASSYEVRPATLQLLSLKNTFPNLKWLDLFIAREHRNIRRAKCLSENPMFKVCHEEFSILSTFPQLQRLRMRIDDFSRCEDIFEAIAILKQSPKLCKVTFINKCNFDPYKKNFNPRLHPSNFDHKKMFTAAALQDMLLDLRHLDSIQLVGFQSLLNEEKDMDQVKSFAMKERINLQCFDCAGQWHRSKIHYIYWGMRSETEID